MFERKTIITQVRQTAAQHNLAARQSINGNNRQTTNQPDNKAKCAGGVCTVDWRPIPLFYRSGQSC
jgi:hypothetical protein